ncbi:hypothetical protein HMPREF0724_14530 [Prescottella equi ATCC 33707]|uniref:Uncharacterized protein n=1 Tax=Prescottella equi ATCC 33707 TaxID=525370 RepID=E9T6X4_RHOHA|nr:hypothetical protein HMPREF0724_14530 [Prescottella equi ATCC 33707]
MDRRFHDRFLHVFGRRLIGHVFSSSPRARPSVCLSNVTRPRGGDGCVLVPRARDCLVSLHVLHSVRYHCRIARCLAGWRRSTAHAPDRSRPERLLIQRASRDRDYLY